MATARRLSLVPFLLVAAACASTASIDRLWADLETDARRAKPLAEPDPAQAQLTAERAAKARRIAESGGLSSARDHLRAAVVLVESPSAADWELAAELGRKAAELGEPLGLRVVAEAIDKDLMAQGKMQRYGTQWIWDRTREAWRLYPVDPATTDDERAAMGVPSYGELITTEIELNAPARERR